MDFTDFSATVSNGAVRFARLDPQTACFETEFLMTTSQPTPGGTLHTHTAVTIRTPAESRDAPYDRVERAAFAALPAYLRRLADEMEAQANAPGPTG